MGTEAVAGRTPFEEIGGLVSVKSVVKMFYQFVLADVELSSKFRGVDIENLTHHQVALISQLLGGPKQYSGRDLVTAHKGLGITRRHFWMVCDLLLATLYIHHVSTGTINRVKTILSSTYDTWVAEEVFVG